VDRWLGFIGKTPLGRHAIGQPCPKKPMYGGACSHNPKDVTELLVASESPQSVGGAFLHMTGTRKGDRLGNGESCLFTYPSILHLFYVLSRICATSHLGLFPPSPTNPQRPARLPSHFAVQQLPAS